MPSTIGDPRRLASTAQDQPIPSVFWTALSYRGQCQEIYRCSTRRGRGVVMVQDVMLWGYEDKFKRQLPQKVARRRNDEYSDTANEDKP